MTKVTKTSCNLSAIRRISENEWRNAASDHQAKVYHLLLNGLQPIDEQVTNVSSRRRQSHPQTQHRNLLMRDVNLNWRALNPKNPVYNFLIEYYGLKGTKGTRTLAKWSPSIYDYVESTEGLKLNNNESFKEVDKIYDGVLLEGATENDIGRGLLNLRGIVSVQSNGIMYNPSLYYNVPKSNTIHSRSSNINDNVTNELRGQSGLDALTKSKSFITTLLWLQTIMKQTSTSEPILHCYNLHEWAMQYQPNKDQPPPSAKYQSHLKYRVSREIINETVERKGIHCSHYDALRFFAPAARSWNIPYKFDELQRSNQIFMEQPACVHANMDMLRSCLRLQPFGDCVILRHVLELAIESRQLDVGASPYDATEYGVPVIPIESSVGRKQYRDQQVKLMIKANPLREELIQLIDVFLHVTFPTNIIFDSKLEFDNIFLKNSGKKPSSDMTKRKQ